MRIRRNLKIFVVINKMIADNNTAADVVTINSRLVEFEIDGLITHFQSFTHKLSFLNETISPC